MKILAYIYIIGFMIYGIYYMGKTYKDKDKWYDNDFDWTGVGLFASILWPVGLVIDLIEYYKNSNK